MPSVYTILKCRDPGIQYEPLVIRLFINRYEFGQAL
jgi:hypothetical protein